MHRGARGPCMNAFAVFYVKVHNRYQGAQHLLTQVRGPLTGKSQCGQTDERNWTGYVLSVVLILPFSEFRYLVRFPSSEHVRPQSLEKKDRSACIKQLEDLKIGFAIIVIIYCFNYYSSLVELIEKNVVCFLLPAPHRAGNSSTRV